MAITQQFKIDEGLSTSFRVAFDPLNIVLTSTVRYPRRVIDFVPLCVSSTVEDYMAELEEFLQYSLHREINIPNSINFTPTTKTWTQLEAFVSCISTLLEQRFDKLSIFIFELRSVCLYNYTQTDKLINLYRALAWWLQLRTLPVRHDRSTIIVNGLFFFLLLLLLQTLSCDV